jgi:hypothetical protein
MLYRRSLGVKCSWFFAAAAWAWASTALAQTDPMLAGAAFARSDLSPLTGVTALSFIPGHGLERRRLDGSSPRPLPAAPIASVTTPAPTAAPSPSQATPILLAARKPSSRQALIKDANTRGVDAPHWSMFLAAGSHTVDYSFSHSPMEGWTNSGLSLEHSLVQNQAMAGLAWRDRAYSALFGVTRLKEKFLMSAVPSVTDNRIGVTLVHEQK